MRIPQTLAMAYAVLLAAGCAREQQNAKYDENISPTYSAGRMIEYDHARDKVSSSSSTHGAAAASDERSGTQSDNSIVASVRELLRQNVEIAPIVPNIQISANNGAVVLSGSVQSGEQKRQIESIAQQAIGVVAINNRLQVLSTPSRQDIGMQNQPGNPLLNPTSIRDNPPPLYQNAGNGADNANTKALNPSSSPDNQMNPPQNLNPTSTSSNSLPRLYQNAGSASPEQDGQLQTPDSNLNTNDSPMH